MTKDQFDRLKKEYGAPPPLTMPKAEEIALSAIEFFKGSTYGPLLGTGAQITLKVAIMQALEDAKLNEP